jgi:hypothetical protein
MNTVSASSYSATVGESLNYMGIRNVILQGGVLFGYAKGGMPYRVFGDVTTSPFGWLRLNAGYSYEVSYLSSTENFSLKVQNARLGVIVYLGGNFTTELLANHHVSDVNNTISYQETGDRLDMNLKWYYRRHSLYAGAYVARNESTNPATGFGSSKLFGYRAQYGLDLMRNLHLGVGYAYDREQETNTSNTKLDTTLSWYYGKLLFTAEYSVQKDQGPLSNRTVNRIFLTMKRFFRKTL